MEVVYKWKRGYHDKIDADVAGKALEQLTEKLGHAPEAADIVEAARPKRSKLHDGFTWDDKEAGKQFRLAEARAMRRNLLYVVEPQGDKKEPIESRVFDYVDLPANGGEARRRWDYTATLMHSEDTRELLLERAKRELALMRAKYAALQELAEVFAAIDRVLEAAE